jgi:hypothetical protein
MAPQTKDPRFDPLIASSEAKVEECLDWDDGGDDLALENGVTAATAEEEQQEKQSLAIAICSLCAAVPALIGSWCWPILVGAMFAGIKSKEIHSLFSIIGISLVALFLFYLFVA